MNTSPFPVLFLLIEISNFTRLDLIFLFIKEQFMKNSLIQVILDSSILQIRGSNSDDLE